MSAPSPVLAPVNTMSKPAGPAVSGTPSDAPPSAFLLFGDQWLTIQNYIAQALQLPLTQGDFEAKYGTFTKKTMVDDCLKAMVDVRNLSGEFGNPMIIKGLIQKDPGYLNAKTPPSEIYGHIVWLSTQIQNQANTFDFTLGSLNQIIGPSAGGTKAEQAANLKEILMGAGGLTSTADIAKNQVQDLVKKMLDFETKFDSANAQLQHYSGSSSEILAAANQAIGTLTTLIAELQDKADKANAEWIALTVSAVAAAVGAIVMGIFTFGIGFAIGAAASIGLGIAAALAKKKYNGLMDQIGNQKEEQARKSRLVTDLTGFNSQISKLAPVMGSFKSSLGEIESVWTGVGGNLAYIVNNFSDDQLSDLSFMMQKLKVVDAQNKWRDIAGVTQQFSSKSLVSYDFSTTWGQKIA